MPGQAVRALVVGISLVSAPVRASPNLGAECLPKPTLPLPSCVPVADAREQALLTLQRSHAWIRTGQLLKAATILAESIGTLDASADVGVLVRSHSLHGEALLGLSSLSAAEAAFRAASNSWAGERALAWIRALPAGEASQRSIQLASNAAALAALRLAEMRMAHVDLALPPFTRGESAQPFAPRPDAELSRAEHAVRAAWRERQRAAFVSYLEERVAPWASRQRAAIQMAERELERVYLVPPVLAPEWRVAVAADIGALWDRFVGRQKRIEASCGVACDELRVAYSSLDDVWQPDKQRARAAFEVCIALSRRYRLLSEYTLRCEHWLARNYAPEYQLLDELMPTAHWTTPWRSSFTARPENRLDMVAPLP